jgi:hypothetical protein
MFFKLKKKPIIFGVIAVALVVLYILLLSDFTGPVAFDKSFPTNGSLDVSTSSSIDIYFKNNVSDEDKNKLYIRFLPGVGFSSKWIAKNQLRVFPQGVLSYGTEYKVDIIYDGQSLQAFNFSTLAKQEIAQTQLAEITKEDQEVLVEDAADTAKGIDALRADYPWYFKLPILEKRYAIVFNNKKSQFRISLYTKGMSDQEQKETLDIAVQRLTSIVGDAAIRYGYYVFINDEYTPSL